MATFPLTTSSVPLPVVPSHRVMSSRCSKLTTVPISSIMPVNIFKADAEAEGDWCDEEAADACADRVDRRGEGWKAPTPLIMLNSIIAAHVVPTTNMRMLLPIEEPDRKNGMLGTLYYVWIMCWSPLTASADRSRSDTLLPPLPVVPMAELRKDETDDGGTKVLISIISIKGWRVHSARPGDSMWQNGLERTL